MRRPLFGTAVTWFVVASVFVPFQPGLARASDVATLALEAREMTASASTLTHEDGRSAWSVTLATRDPGGFARLRIRICEEHFLCSEFEQPLADSEFIMGANANYAQINANISGLGDVSVINYSYSFPATFNVCPNDQTRSLLVATGQPVAQAGFAYGGRIGPWTIKGGGCGFNGVNGSAVWISP